MSHGLNTRLFLSLSLAFVRDLNEKRFLLRADVGKAGDFPVPFAGLSTAATLEIGKAAAVAESAKTHSFLAAGTADRKRAREGAKRARGPCVRPPIPEAVLRRSPPVTRRSSETSRGRNAGVTDGCCASS